MDLYFKATSSATERSSAQKAAVFLHIAGQEAIDIFNTFKLSPAERDDYSVIVKKFEEYCTPKRNKTYERYIVRTQQQRDGKPFEQFLRDVQLKAQGCNLRLEGINGSRPACLRNARQAQDASSMGEGPDTG